MVKIVIPDDYPPVISESSALERLRGLGEVVAYTTAPESEDELIERIKEAEIAVNIRAYCRFTANVFERCTKLRQVSVWGTGVDNVDLVAANRHGVTVTNTPNTATESIAEHALTLMLAVARQVPQIDRKVREGQWPRGLVTQLHGKTLGVVGTGAIGQQVARLARGIGMKVLAWTYNPTPERAKEYGVTYVSLDELLRQADVVSLHVRLTEDSRGLIGRSELAKMKQSAILVNTALGVIVDNAALLDALRGRRIAGAGLDVYPQEPIDPADPLLTLDNAVLTPHSAGQTPEVLERGLHMSVDNVESFLKGTPANVVNRPGPPSRNPPR